MLILWDREFTNALYFVIRGDYYCSYKKFKERGEKKKREEKKSMEFLWVYGQSGLTSLLKIFLILLHVLRHLLTLLFGRQGK